MSTGNEHCHPGMIQNRQGRWVPELWASRAEHYRIKDHLTISTDDFTEVILKALQDRKPLSVVRMSDGEDELLIWCKAHGSENLMPNGRFPIEWLKRLGIYGIPCYELLNRLTRAARESMYFSPDGERNHLREHFGLREDHTLVELYYPYRMPVAKKREMFEEAERVLVVNGYMQYVDMIQAGAPDEVEIEHVSVRSWEEHERVLLDVHRSDAQLVLVSAGPGGKWMIPVMAAAGKVVLDIGDGMGSFWWSNGISPEGKTMSTTGTLEDRK